MKGRGKNDEVFLRILIFYKGLGTSELKENLKYLSLEKTTKANNFRGTYFCGFCEIWLILRKLASWKILGPIRKNQYIEKERKEK